MVRHICLSSWSSTFLLDSFALLLTPVSFAFLHSALWTTQILVSGLCSMELSPDLTPSLQLYISLQIFSKDAAFPVPVAFSSSHCDRCMCVGGERGRERGREGERESVCVCVCVFRWIHRWVSPTPTTHPPSVYLALRANDHVRRFINIHLHYITLHDWLS